MTDDAELIRRYAEQRSEEAFAELVRRHLGLVYSAALRRLGGDAHGATDVAQGVFVKLARDAARLSGHAALTGWLYTATRHAAVDLIRSNQRRAAREQEAFTMNEILSAEVRVGASAETEVEWARLQPVLDAAMDELGERDREAVLLRYFEERPFAEIGATLRVSEDAARMRVERALEKLRGVLARRGVTSTGAALGVVLANQAVVAAPAALAGTVVGAATAAGVAGGGGMLMGVFTFMSTGKIVVSVAIVCAAVGIGSAVYQAGEVARANDTVVALQRERTAAEAKAAALEARVQAVELNARVVAGRSAAPERKGEVESARTAATGSNARVERIMEARLRSQIADARFMKLFQRLGLTAKENEALKEVLGERESSKIAVLRQAQGGGIALSDDEIPRRIHAAQAEVDRAIEKLLGSDRYAVYRDFTDNVIPYSLLDRVEQGAVAAGSSLSGDQSRAVLELLKNNHAAAQATKPTRGLPIDATDSFQTFIAAGPISEHTMTKAAEVLSADQLQVVKNVQNEHLALSKIIPSMGDSSLVK